MKCFMIDCGGDNGGQLYFASTSGKAKAQAIQAEDCGFTEIESCIRRPQYDQYAPGLVPIEVMMADGWWFECTGCNNHVSDDSDYDYEAEIPASPVIEKGLVWCSAICKARDAVRNLKYKLEDAEAELSATVAVLKRFPGVTFVRVNKGSRLIPHCQFRLSTGAEIGWDIGSEFVYVTPIDRWQWNDYEDRRFQDRQIGSWESEGGLAA